MGEKAEPTPGPWSVTPSPHGGMVLHRPGSEQTHIQIVPCSDALLMAASRDMYEALEQIATGHLTGGPKHTAHTSRVKSRIALEALRQTWGESND